MVEGKKPKELPSLEDTLDISRRCQGEWRNGELVNGSGQWRSPLTMWQFDGEWTNGEKQGQGKYYFSDSGSTFEGKWEEGSFTSGKWVYKDGSTFEGGFADGVPAGVGVYTFMSNGLSQRGQFVDGVWKGETIVPVA